jgi:hypothetical protein
MKVVIQLIKNILCKDREIKSTYMYIILGINPILCLRSTGPRPPPARSLTLQIERFEFANLKMRVPHCRVQQRINTLCCSWTIKYK